MPSDNPLKRSLTDTNDQHHADYMPFNPPANILTPPNTTTPDSKHHAASADFRREPSPALSTTSTLSSLPASTVGSALGAQVGPGNSSASPVKRRKLTIAEKEQRKLEKEAKVREREERRAEKEAEILFKAEKRRQEAEIKEEKQKIKEAENAAKAEKKRQEAEAKEEKQRLKDLAKKQKEEEDAKKQRAQLRLGSFFIKATPTKSSASIPATDLAETEPQDDAVPAQSSPSKLGSKSTQSKCSDYHSHFLPFNLPSHTTLAPNIVGVASSDAEHAQQLFDKALRSNSSSHHSVQPIRVVLGLGTYRRRGRLPMRADRVIERLQGSSSRPIDLTGEHALQDSNDPSTDLAGIDIKHLHFCEDVRPPWTGSYTKVTSERKATKAARNPTFRVRDDTNYDYDSEVEWEEPEEGEDLLSDGEDDAESVGSADEMEEFLDDGEIEDSKAGRRLITSELEPISSGICWEHDDIKRAQPDPDLADTSLSGMRLEWLVDTTATSIDPFSDSYWQVRVAPPLAQTDLFGRPITSSPAGAALMKPPRLPLQPASDGVNQKVIVNAKSGEKGPIMAITAPKSTKSSAPKLTGTAFDQFKEAVEGSNLTKVDLLKALKQRFPQFTNDTIKETLNSNFARHGATNPEKRWKLMSTS